MGIFFAILAAASFGLNVSFDKLILGKYNPHPVMISVYSGVFTLVAGIIILFFTGFYTLHPESIFFIVCSGVLTQLYLLPYFKALSDDESTRISSLFQFIPVF